MRRRAMRTNRHAAIVILTFAPPRRCRRGVDTETICLTYYKPNRGIVDPIHFERAKMKKLRELSGAAGSVLLLAAMVCCTLLAQLTVSTIRGTATDPSGAAVVNARIEVMQLETNSKRAVTTNESGDYEIADLPRGTYRLTATSAGFKTVVADRILLETTEIRRINIAFEVGAVSAEVTVSAAAAVISTDSSKIQGSFTRQTFVDAPLIGDGRNPALTLSVLPQVQSVGGIYNVQMAGQSSSQLQQGQDGHTNDGANNQTSNIHDVEEVIAVPVNNTAEFARVGYYNMVTKSGTNEFHGQAYYWHRNSAFDARNFFANQKPVAKNHTMHAGVTGPILKDKLFFYGGWSAQRWPGGSSYLRDVPTDLMRRGDFSQLLSQSRPTVVRDPLTGQPFSGNVIPTSRLNQVSVKMQDTYLPTANTGPAGALANNYFYIWPWPGDLRNMNIYTARIDYNVSAKNRLSGRLLESWADYVLNNNYPTLGWTRVRRGNHLVLEDTYVVSPSLVNTFRFGYYQADVVDGSTVDGYTPQKGDDIVKALGIQGVNPQGLSAMGFPRADITGYSSIFNRFGGHIQDFRDYGYADSVTWSKGRHVFKFGAEIKPFSQFDGSVPEGTYGIFNFNGSLSGYGYADFLLGLPFSSTRLDPLTNRTRRDSETGLYAQDTFKVNSRLNLDLGLRWDRFGAATYEDELIYNWDPATGNVIVPDGMLSKISPLYPKTINVAEGEVKQRPSRSNFAPRFGIAYRPFGQDTVIRGAYGLFTETLGVFARAQSGGPYQLSETFNNVIQNGAPLFSFPNPFPSGSGAVASQSVTGYPLDTDNGAIHQFNVTVEHQIRDTGFRLTYLGSRSRGFNYTRSTNKPQASLTPFTQSRRPYPQFIGATYSYSDGASNYNALTFEVKRKVGQLMFDNHWTWSSNYYNQANLDDPYAPLFWARQPDTFKQRLVLNVIWQIPVGHGRRFMANAPVIVDHLLGGWELYWIAYMESGSYFSPSFSGSDPSNTNTVGGLPDRIANGNLDPDNRTINRWFDASAFVVPPAGRFGNSGANVLEGPGRHEHDATILKRFRITERLAFSYAMAITNLFNHPNFNNPASNISVPGSVGIINSTKSYAPNRQMVMRLRLDF
jgi:outer membrane receptor protein involved in Fe transport